MSMQSLMIRASAGSGKTFQLSNRFLALLAAGADPSELIALTFTRKAAGEFADRILSRLAKGSLSDEEALKLTRELSDTLAGNTENGMPALFPAGDKIEPDLTSFRELLEKLVASLHRVSLGTLDSFFVRIVKRFPYELGLAEFRLLEEEALQAEKSQVLARIFREVPERQREAFLGAFRLATHGKEHNRLCRLLDDFLDKHHQRYLSAPLRGQWGNLDLIWPDGCPWEHVEDFHQAAQEVMEFLPSVGVDKKPHATWLKGWQKAADWFRLYAPGDGRKTEPAIDRTLGLLADLSRGHAVDVFSGMEHRISGRLADAMTRLIGGYLRGEIEARATRTTGLWSLLWAYESIYEAEVRRRGGLGFADVTRLLSAGGLTDDGRARIESRLDARYRHWLLDEFQDTSRGQWEVLEGLLDEAILDPEGERSLFVVGDTKQGIYGWRGGEPRLFDDLLQRPGWPVRMKEWGMETSWRSSVEVLGLANLVCDPAVMRGRFPEAAVRRWNYVNHRSAQRVTPLAGYAVVVDTDEDSGEEEEIGGVEGALRDVLAHVNPIARGLSCAVLVRSNDKARKLVDFIRKEFPGMPVEMDAEVELALDNPVGVALMDFFRWLGHPADRLAQGHVMASPLGPVLGEWAEGPRLIWHHCRKRVLERGMAGVMQDLAAGLKSRGVLNPFLEGRLGGILRAALEYDESGRRDFDEWVRVMESLKQREYSAEGALQVMTVHKAKGLEFDMVVLPDLAGGVFDDPSKAGILEFKDESGRIESLLLSPSKKLLEADPALSARFEAWSAEQCYERFCNLYVALTRAKHATYVLLPKAPANPSSGRRHDLWIRSAVSGGGTVEWNGRVQLVLHESGDAAWFADASDRGDTGAKEEEGIHLGAAIARREKVIPSAAKKGGFAFAPAGVAFGNEVHAAFERIRWIDGDAIDLPGNTAGQMVRELLEVPEIRSVFLREGREVELRREQPVDTILDGKWLSGTIDRLHILRDSAGAVEAVEIVDFKTDAVSNGEELIARYAEQMAAYREAVSRAFGVPVKCRLLSTRLKKCFDC
ncbi:UvrD-helicase domain-containing protein [Luteolibacter sp. GHJ8]|uniref:DNA 3'-5' helicase n=1 Tax=Luteolibacter rhizosphaerae TaxID=2989719 RepID=A0ABT3G627_9BACT|nr:UvrD-helicase domain-containing protein [Luteolibacter rhizosphaerae]MCW1915273.1 UvrD-helicase domain-containing protein [Luteolibacter rhizosphaerae]